MLNNALLIHADDRDQSGGSHTYEMAITLPYGNVKDAGRIEFQKGPLKEAGLNGISDEALIAIVIDRLEGFQAGRFLSEYNANALRGLREALASLQKRTSDRESRGVEGTHNV